MRFTVVTYGSEGDTRPFVGLCRGLMDAGHAVQLFLESSTIDSARSHGIPAETLAGDIKSTLPVDNPSRELQRSDVLNATKHGLRVVRSNTVSWTRTIANHALGPDAILFGGLASPVSATVALQLSKPAINLCLQPTTPTRAFGACTLPPMKLPGWMNVLTYRVSPRAMMWRFYGKATSAAEEVFGNRARSASANVRGTRIEAQPLANMIELASRGEIRQRAKELAVSVFEEDGVTNTVKRLECVGRRFEVAIPHGRPWRQRSVLLMSPFTTRSVSCARGSDTSRA